MWWTSEKAPRILSLVSVFFLLYIHQNIINVKQTEKTDEDLFASFPANSGLTTSNASKQFNG